MDDRPRIFVGVVRPRLMAAVLIPLVVFCVLTLLVNPSIGAAVMIGVFFVVAAVAMWASLRYSRTRRGHD